MYRLLQNPSQRLPLLSAVALSLLTSVASAASLGTDNANQPAYELADGNGSNDGDPANNTNDWVSGDNGSASGAAFQGWQLSLNGGNGIAGFYIGDSRGIASGSGANINVGNESFGLYGQGSDKAAEAVRLFSSALSVGQTFSIDLGVNFRNGFKGIDLRDGSSATIFNFNVGNLAGNDDYFVQFAATGNGSIGNGYDQNTAFRLAFTQTSLSGGTWSITRSGGLSDLDTGTYSGLAAGFKLYVGNTGSGSQNDLVANNLSIVPEPATAAVAFLGGAVLLNRRRRLIGGR